MTRSSTNRVSSRRRGSPLSECGKELKDIKTTYVVLIRHDLHALGVLVTTHGHVLVRERQLLDFERDVADTLAWEHRSHFDVPRDVVVFVGRVVGERFVEDLELLR